MEKPAYKKGDVLLTGRADDMVVIEVIKVTLRKDTGKLYDEYLMTGKVLICGRDQNEVGKTHHDFIPDANWKLLGWKTKRKAVAES